jgi:hypothetical protein
VCAVRSGNGKLNRKEIERALDMWNIPNNPDKVEEIFSSCDADSARSPWASHTRADSLGHPLGPRCTHTQ